MFMNRPGVNPVLSPNDGAGGPAGSEPGADLPAPPLAPEGWPIVGAFFAAGALLTWGAVWLLGAWGWIVGGACAVLCLWCVWFFRDPKRRIPGAKAGRMPIISPADGVVCFVGSAVPPAELGLKPEERAGLTRVSVFMNVFNVHVNRTPLAGVVEKSVYKPGKFFNASFDKASELNERHSLIVRADAGVRLICVQIAGLIARRIVCRVSEGERLLAGQRYGLIRFGSRVDVYVPGGIAPMVKVGDVSVAGETVLAWIEGDGSHTDRGEG